MLHFQSNEAFCKHLARTISISLFKLLLYQNRTGQEYTLHLLLVAKWPVENAHNDITHVPHPFLLTHEIFQVLYLQGPEFPSQTKAIWLCTQSHLAMQMCQSINTVSSILHTCVCICVCHQLPPLSCLSLFYWTFYTLDRFMVLFQLFNPLPHQPVGKQHAPMLMRCSPRHEFSLSAYGKIMTQKATSSTDNVCFFFIPESQLSAERKNDNYHPQSQVCHCLAQNQWEIRSDQMIENLECLEKELDSK